MRPTRTKSMANKDQTTNASSQPEPGAPDNGYVDASAATFSWKTTGSAILSEAYELQIARDASFSDVVQSLPVGKADSVTLYELLPASGETMYWRVRGQSGGTWGSWSRHASFVASTRNEPIVRARTQPGAAPRTAGGTGSGRGTAAVATTAGATARAVQLTDKDRPASPGQARRGQGHDALENTIDGTTSSGDESDDSAT